MNDRGEGARRSLREWFADYRKAVIMGLAVSLTLGAITGGFFYVRDRVFSEPLKADMPAGDGEKSIRPLFDIQIKPRLTAYCGEPAWIRWFGRVLWGRHCRRLIFEPHELADMQTHRLPFVESGYPLELLDAFIRQHQGCLAYRLEGDTYVVHEPTPSDVIREDGRIICPRT